MASIKHPKFMVTGVLADRRPVELHLFRNYRSPEDILEVKRESHYKLPAPPEEQYIWEEQLELPLHISGHLEDFWIVLLLPIIQHWMQ